MVHERLFNVGVSAVKSYFPTLGGEGRRTSENAVDLHMFCPCRKISSTCRQHRLHLTGSWLYFSSDDERHTRYFSSALKKPPPPPPTSVGIEPVVTGLKAIALRFVTPKTTREKKHVRLTMVQAVELVSNRGPVAESSVQPGHHSCLVPQPAANVTLQYN